MHSKIDNQNKIYYWHGILDPRGLSSDYELIIKKIIEGDYQGLDLEKLAGHHVYSVRVNDSNRLLLTTIIINGKPYLMLLDDVLNHDYAKSRFLKPAVLKNYLELHGKPISQELLNKHFEKQEDVVLLPPKSSESQGIEYSRIDFYNQKFIELDETQLEIATTTTFPLIISGAPGSGKSCIALLILGQYVNAASSIDDYPVLYVTESNTLASSMQRAWQSLPVAQNLAADAVQFKSYEQLVKYLVPQTANMTFVDKNHCMTWLAIYIQTDKKVRKTTKTNTLDNAFYTNLDAIYQEFRIIAGFTDITIYQTVGKKNSLFHKKDKQEWLYKACKLYQESLESKGLIHAPFYPLQLKYQFKLIVVDEAQDLSHRQLEVLFKLASNQQICFCEDNRQSLADNKSKIPFIKGLMKKKNQISMDKSYRCPEAIIRMANAVSRLKATATGHGQPEITIPATQKNKGKVTWFDSLKDEELTALRQMASSPDFAIVTLPEYIAEAKKLFGTPLVFTPQEIKGLEYKNILTYQILNDPLLKEADKLIGEQDSEIIKKSGNRAKKDQDYEQFGPAFNAVFTAFTRSMDTLIVVQDNHHLLSNITKKLKDARLEKQNKPLVIPDLASQNNTADWFQQVKIQLEQGNDDIARDIYVNKLHKTANEFKALKSGFFELQIICSPTVQISTPIQNPHKKAVSTHKTQKQIEQEKIEGYLNGLCENLTETELHNLLQSNKAKEFLFEHPLRDGACLFTHLFYEQASFDMLINYLLKFPELLSGLTRDALCRARTKEAGVHANTSPLYWLSFLENGSKLFLKLLTDHPNAANLITAKALCLPLTKAAGGDANISPLFVLSSLPRGLKILKLLLTNNANLVQSINANALCLPLTSKSGQLANHSPLYMLCCSAEGRDILYNLLTKNTRLAKSISPEALCLDATSFRSPAYFLSTTKDGKKIMQFLIRNAPGLADALKNQIAKQIKETSPSQSGFFAKRDILAEQIIEKSAVLFDDIEAKECCSCSAKGSEVTEAASWRCNLF